MRYVQITQKKCKSGGIYAKRTKDAKYSRAELNQIGQDKIAFVLLPELKPAQKLNLVILIKCIYYEVPV